METVAKYRLGKANISIYGRPGDYTFRDFKRGSAQRLVPILQNERVKKVAVPMVAEFNAEIAPYADFPTEQAFGDYTLRTGLYKDAVMLAPGESAIIITGDCPTVVFYNSKTKEAAVAHAGRESIIDSKRIESSAPSRSHESIVGSVLEYANWQPKGIEVLVCAGIGPENFEHSFSHPQYGSVNKKLVKYIFSAYGRNCILGNIEEGKINMFEIIKAQCVAAGIPVGHIKHDGLDTFTDPRLWSHRNPGKKNGRNATLVSNGSRMK